MVQNSALKPTAAVKPHEDSEVQNCAIKVNVSTALDDDNVYMCKVLAHRLAEASFLPRLGSHSFQNQCINYIFKCIHISIRPDTFMLINLNI